VIFVIDACVAVKWYLDEPQSEEAHALLLGQHTLLAPVHALGEIGHVLLKRFRKEEINRDQFDRAIKGVLRTVAFLPIVDFIEEAVHVAAETDQSFYDAIYVAAAVHSNGVLITTDERLLLGLQSTRWASRSVALSEAVSPRA
jgi:predicted nucleic acid-binding protein